MPRPCQDGLVCPPHAVGHGFMPRPCQDGLVCPPHAVGHGFMPRPCQDGLVVSVSASCGRSWVHAPAMSGWLSG